MQAITGDLIPARHRAKYQADIGVIATLAVMGGPILGGVFTDDLSWRWIFFINLPVGVIAMIIIAVRLRLPVHRSPRGADLAGGITVTLFTTAALLVAVWGGTRYGWASPQILGLIAAVVVTGAGFGLIEHRAADPITPLGLFRSSVFSISSALFFLATLVARRVSLASAEHIGDLRVRELLVVPKNEHGPLLSRQPGRVGQDGVTFGVIDASIR